MRFIILTQHIYEDPAAEGAPLTRSSSPRKLTVLLGREALVVSSIVTVCILESEATSLGHRLVGFDGYLMEQSPV